MFGRPRSNRPTNRPQLAHQLAADGATGLGANQLDGVDSIRDVVDVADVADNDSNDSNNGFRTFGSQGECRQNFHCKGTERCVKRNGEFM